LFNITNHLSDTNNNPVDAKVVPSTNKKVTLIIERELYMIQKV